MEWDGRDRMGRRKEEVKLRGRRVKRDFGSKGKRGRYCYK